jgi:hypothetical protein
MSEKRTAHGLAGALALGLLAAPLCGCGGHAYHVTPVVAAPTSPADEKALGAALLGEWRNWSTVHTDGKEEEERTFRVFLTFRPDGTGDQGIGDKRAAFKYRVEGKNVITTDPSLGTLRADTVKPDELRFFWYALSVTVVYKHDEAFTGLRR